MLELLPNLFGGVPGESFTEQQLEFQPLTVDGRSKVEIHRLYSATDSDENGPAAAVLRYLPGATAPLHLHPGYELIYILSGSLETDDGKYGPNSLLIMPPNSVHAPRSPDGCVGLVVWEQPVRPVNPLREPEGRD